MFVTIINGPARHLGRMSLPLKTTQAFDLYRNGVVLCGVRYRRVSGKPGDQTLSCGRIDRRA